MFCVLFQDDDEEDEDASGDDEESDADTCEADDDDDEYLNNVRTLWKFCIFYAWNSFQNIFLSSIFSIENANLLLTFRLLQQTQQTAESTNTSINWTLNSTAELNDSSVLWTGTSEQPNTVETFCNTPHPTSNQFDALNETDKLQAFRDYLKVCSTNRNLLFLIKLHFPMNCNVNSSHFAKCISNVIAENTREGLPCPFSVCHRQTVGHNIEKSRGFACRYRIVQRLFWIRAKNESGKYRIVRHCNNPYV